MTDDKNKIKKDVGSTFFPEEIVRKLDLRQEELSSGHGFEVEGTHELRQKIKLRNLNANAALRKRKKRAA